MNQPFHDNDDALFDRLADGELSAAERRQLLASLDDRADGWRRCALAFLEAQSWRGEMRRMVSDVQPPVATLPLPERRTQPSHVGIWLATAAGLLVAFGLGRQLSTSPNSGEVLLAEAPVNGAAPADREIGPDADAVTLVVHDRNGVPQRMQVPLVEASTLGKQFADAPHWAAPEMKKKLAQQGVEMQARRRYAPLYFEQENRIVPMIVPVDDAVVTPVSRPIY
jgi:hypothetical protein